MRKIVQLSMFAAAVAALLIAKDGRADPEIQDAGPENSSAKSSLLSKIPEAWAEAFGAIRADPRPEKLTRGSHYWISDEKRHDLFKEAITDKGGVFIGLGTDQNYLMAGWSRPEILVPLDFDQMVVYLHYAFRVVFLNAKTPKEFINSWSDDRFKKTKQLIQDAYADKDSKFLKGVLHAFKKGRRLVYPRLKRVLRSYRRLKIPTYLNDEAQYRFVVQLFETNRVFPVRGDLTASKTVKDVAKAASNIGLPVRTMYLSNAEQYFKYSTDFRENMFALPFDEQSVVIRTVGKRTPWSADGLYEYVVQSGENFHLWLKYPKTYTVWTMVNARKVDKRTGGSEITRLPPTLDEKNQK
ncbi:MAG: hypothetical protein GY847_03970 [Proteobacteria bacterium]|nr:hypothetical protein [Pseudomonadota bacterium]